MKCLNSTQLEGDTITLKILTPSYCSQKYVNWLNDPDVNQYLETRFIQQTLSSISNFVNSKLNSDIEYLFGIFYKENQLHIGNIKLGPVHPNYHYADVSYFIGEKSYWGRGIATQAIRLVLKFGFTHLNLKRIQAGVIEGNVASTITLLKNGFKREGASRNQIVLNGENKDHLRYGILKSEFQKKHSVPHLTKVPAFSDEI